jgi:hypothetical protein
LTLIIKFAIKYKMFFISQMIKIKAHLIKYKKFYISTIIVCLIIFIIGKNILLNLLLYFIGVICFPKKRKIY